MSALHLMRKFSFVLLHTSVTDHNLQNGNPDCCRLSRLADEISRSCVICVSLCLYASCLAGWDFPLSLAHDALSVLFFIFGVDGRLLTTIDMMNVPTFEVSNS